jgi:plastocyanin domain-containing protein
MNAWMLAPSALLAAALALPAAARACDECDHAAKDHAVNKVALASAATKTAPASAKVTKGVRTIELAVTSEGFVPAEVKAKAGETVKLVVTRKVQRTCATEIVMKDLGVNQPLPLDKPVTVTVKPPKAGTYRYACGMDMIAGQLVVD